MIKYCVEKWDKNKGILEKALRTGTGFNECGYEKLVALVVDCILNGGNGRIREWDSEHITVVDNGDYQGTLLFLIPMATYQPDASEYLMANVYYGSCSGCDTLQAIQDWGEKQLTEEQVKDFMTLCKDIVTSMIKPYNVGWRADEIFKEVEWEDEEDG